MNFDFTDDQQAIKATAREFLADRFRIERVRELAERGEHDEALWREVAELGWPGIYIDEAHGGQGLGQVELTILMEELGYALAPTPFFSNAAAGLLIRHAGSDEQRERHLPGIASGEQRAAAGMTRDGEALVADAEGAATVVALRGDRALLVAEPRSEPVATIDSTRPLARVALDGAEELPRPVEPAADRVRVALGGELVGVAQRALEMSVQYARERKQFGRPIGAYQAVSHRCAQMLLEVEGARAATLYAAWAADNEPETLPLAAAMAKAYASDAATRVTASALQVHGGIAFTWEHDLHFFLKRANAGARMLGTAREQRDRVAGLAGLG